RDDDNEIYLFKPKTQERKSAAARPPHPCQLLCVIKFFHDHSWIGKCSGSAFQMLVNFPVTGDSSQVKAVDVTLTNSAGSVTINQLDFQ
ncbi:MAG TPA: hypothetical protein VIY49_12740, partial [Bryobacteraceae bacterium]